MATRQKVSFPLRLEDEVERWVIEKAKREERSRNWMINRILKEEMLREQGKA